MRPHWECVSLYAGCGSNGVVATELIFEWLAKQAYTGPVPYVFAAKEMEVVRDESWDRFYLSGVKWSSEFVRDILTRFGVWWGAGMVGGKT